jgi:hypothetical protein
VSWFVAQWEIQYDQLRRRLSGIGWISEGYVQDRGPGAGGPCYQCTRKVKGKTVSVALSKEQFEWLRAAIAQWRDLKATFKEMQQIRVGAPSSRQPWAEGWNAFGVRGVWCFSAVAMPAAEKVFSWSDQDEPG